MSFPVKVKMLNHASIRLTLASRPWAARLSFATSEQTGKLSHRPADSAAVIPAYGWNSPEMCFRV